ncbi:MAG: iron-containing alcohol dehydrogenase [Clostridiales bacterium]|nr:iron-containing alcohol dehydrogenase [Clostridiales bacterium]
MSSDFRYVMNTEIVFGVGSSKKLASIIAEQGGSKAFIVSDKGVEASGLLDGLQADLKAANVAFGLFDDVEQSSSVQSVDKGADSVRNEGYDIIIAVGGGSALDTGKAIGLVVGNGGQCRDYVGAGKAKKPSMPVIALPTTAGTSAEVTDVAVIADREINARSGLRSNYIVPRVAIVDPLLTVSVPPSVTAATGMDALSHAIESYTNTVSELPHDLASLEAMRLIGRALPAAVANGKNLKAREDMCMACVLIGLAYRNTRLGILHAITGPFCGYYEVAHGVANAILLPHVMRFNATGNYEKFANIAKALGVSDECYTTRELALLSADMVADLLEDVGLPADFKAMNLDHSKLGTVAKEAAKSANLAINPRVATENDLLAICNMTF